MPNDDPTPPAREPVVFTQTMCDRLANTLAQLPIGDSLLSTWLDARGLKGAYRLRITAALMEPVVAAPPAA